MITVKVSYTVKEGFAGKNRDNISDFLKSFRELKNDDFRYTVYVLDDKKTFVHLSMYKNEQIQKQLLDIPSFKSFQKQRDESGLEVAPKIEFMEIAGSSHEIF